MCWNSRGRLFEWTFHGTIGQNYDQVFHFSNMIFFPWNCHKFCLFILFSAPWPSILKNKPNASRKEMMKIMTRYSLHLFYFDLFFSWNCNNQLTELFVYILRALKNNLRKRTRKMSIHYPNWVTWSMLCFPRIKRPFCLFSTK